MVTHDAERRELRGPGRLPGRRRDRRRDARADRRARPRPPEVAGDLAACGAPPSRACSARKLRLVLTALVDRARRRVHGGHLRPDRHDERGLRRAVHAGLVRERRHRPRRGRVHAQPIRTRRWRR